MANASFIRPGTNRRWPVIKPVGSHQQAPPISINRNVCLVGARARVHLPLGSPLVSRSHVLIVNDNDETYLRDLASTNKVYVNGTPVREVRLNTADLLRVGPFTFHCQSGFPGGPVASPEELADDAPAQEQPTVLAVDGGPRVTLSGRTLLIGRRRDCDVRLEASGISPVHAVIFKRDGKRFIRDLNSTEGTFVNGAAIREAQVQPGDQIRIGAAAARLEAVTPSGAGAQDEQAEPLPLEMEEVTSASASGLSGSVGAATELSESQRILAGLAAIGAGAQQESAAGAQQEGAPQEAAAQASATPEDFGFAPEPAAAPAGPSDAASPLELELAPEPAPAAPSNAADYDLAPAPAESNGHPGAVVRQPPPRPQIAPIPTNGQGGANGEHATNVERAANAAPRAMNAQAGGNAAGLNSAGPLGRGHEPIPPAQTPRSPERNGQEAGSDAAAGHEQTGPGEHESLPVASAEDLLPPAPPPTAPAEEHQLAVTEDDLLGDIFFGHE